MVMKTVEAAGVRNGGTRGRGREERQGGGSFSNTLGEARGQRRGMWLEQEWSVHWSSLPGRGRGRLFIGKAVVTVSEEVRRALPLEMKARKSKIVQSWSHLVDR